MIKMSLATCGTKPEENTMVIYTKNLLIEIIVLLKQDGRCWREESNTISCYLLVGFFVSLPFGADKIGLIVFM